VIIVRAGEVLNFLLLCKTADGGEGEAKKKYRFYIHVRTGDFQNLFMVPSVLLLLNACCLPTGGRCHSLQRSVTLCCIYNVYNCLQSFSQQQFFLSQLTRGLRKEGSWNITHLLPTTSRRN
jgi:hypothetical protein